MKRNYELIIVGGGSAGLAAAVSAVRNGVRDLAILETDRFLGGVLRQCIHSGFGLHTFGEELTGPEYAERYIRQIAELPVEILTESPVLEIRPDRTVVVISRKIGYCELHAKALVIATGCRERPAGAISIAGTRPAGIMTAGTAQRYINLEGYMVGRRIVILGSGDIGLIMARRLTLEGAKVLCVAELMPYSNGLTRNIVQCLDDYGIPLYLSHTVTRIHGSGRVTAVTLSKVDEATRVPIPGTEMLIECDTLLLSVGLIPESELIREAGAEVSPSGGITVGQDMQSTIPGVFACGNVVHVHDLVDFVSQEGELAGAAAARYIRSSTESAQCFVRTEAGDGVLYVVPQRIDPHTDGDVTLSFRVRRPFRSSEIRVKNESGEVLAAVKKPFMIPAEMERLILRHDKLPLCSSKIVLTAEDRDEKKP